MIALNNESTPSIAVHSGFVLKEELESRHITQRKFAEIIGVPNTQLNEILIASENQKARQRLENIRKYCASLL